MAKEVFGDYELFTIKTGCERICRVPGLQKEISAAAERVRDITYEASLLANRHFVRCMGEHGALESDCFSQAFFYACMQFVGGKNPERPQSLQETTFAKLQQSYCSYVLLRPNDLPVPDASPFWHALSAAAANMEKDARNHVVMNFDSKVQEYVILLLRKAVDGKGLIRISEDYLHL